MPPFSSDMFQYSTVMANGGKFATVFHQYWKTMAKNISGTWWHNCHRFSPICSNTPSSWQMMANDGQNATIFHSLYQSPVFFTLFHHRWKLSILARSNTPPFSIEIDGTFTEGLLGCKGGCHEMTKNIISNPVYFTVSLSYMHLINHNMTEPTKHQLH